MAAAADSLSSEFECAICSDQLKQPTFIGPCSHTFCRDCIQQYWVSLGWRVTIPCPECTQECPIPPNGVDDLKSNFKLSNIIDAYRNQQQRTAANPAEVKCTLCQNVASCFCKECELKLCSICRRHHDHHPQTGDHDLFGLCLPHGNALFFFCTVCNQAACSGCRFSDHYQGDHDMTPIHPVVGNLMSRFQALSAELEGAITTQGEQERKLSRLRDIVQQKMTAAEVQATASAKRTIIDIRNEIQDLLAESQTLQNQIYALIKRKEKVDTRTKQLVEDVDKLEKDTKVFPFTKSCEDIDLCLRSLDTFKGEMTTKLEESRRAVCAKIIIETESIANLTSINQELENLVRTSRESDTETVLEEVRRSIGELRLDVDMGQDLTVLSGDQQIRKGKAKRVFRHIKKVCTLPFPTDRPCRFLFRLKHLHVPVSRLATLGRSKNDSRLDLIHFYDEVSSTLTGTIEKGVHAAWDMAVSSTGELLLARKNKPPAIRVITPGTGAHREVNILGDNGEKVIDMLRFVETDESDNMFLSTGYNDPLLLVVRPTGNVMQCVQLQGRAYYMAFCSINRILYLAADDRIRRFFWSINMGLLKEISSSSHGLAGFHCGDVCIGSGCEVLVTGWIENGDIVIYQVTEGEDEDDLVWKKIDYQDDVQRRSENSPHICVRDDNLWLGYDDNLEKFQLLV